MDLTTQEERQRINSIKAAIAGGSFSYTEYVPAICYVGKARDLGAAVTWAEATGSLKLLEEAKTEILLQVSENPLISLWCLKLAWIVDAEHAAQMKHGRNYIGELQREFISWARRQGAKIDRHTSRQRIMAELWKRGITFRDLPRQEYYLFFY